MSNEDRFADAPISRRRFFQLSGAVGASLALPGNAAASTSAEAFTEVYEYVLNHTPTDHAVPTLVRFDDESGPEAMSAALGSDTEAVTTTDPEPAAYAKLTATEASTVAELPSASEFQFSPGSNPFWRIGYYPLGVFPEPRRSVDLIGFEQLKDGLAELEDRYPDRIRVKNVGRSPGHYNNATDREDPKGMYVAELTNFDSETDFADKEKVFYSCSLHGPEDAGRETAARLLENVARSSEPDIEGSDVKVEPLLDEVVLLLGFTNPDGWVTRNPQYDSSWQLNTRKIPFAPLYERGNAEVYDSNRQYPVVGMITPVHYPAQPNDPKSEEEETPSFVYEKVPDAKAFVDFFSQYDNLGYGADLHGGPVFNEFVLGLISQDQFDTRQMNELYEMCLNIDETLEAALEVWVTAGDIRTTLLGDEQYDPLLFGVLPEEAFDYSTIYDTIDYTVTGAFLDWMAHPEPIGLDLTTLDFEMSFSWAVNGQYYDPELQSMKVKGYRTAIRTITAFAVRNSDTPTTSDQFSARTETGGEDVAYVTSGTDALRTTDATLDFEADGGGDGGSAVARTTEEVTLSADVTELTVDVEDGLHSMGLQVQGGTMVADVEVVDPDGDVVGEYEGVTDERGGNRDFVLPEFTAADPEPGTWTVRVDNEMDAAQRARFLHWTLAASGDNPDPRTAWPGGEGYEQRAYDVSPYRFFEDYGEFMADGRMDAVTVGEVANGALVDAGGNPAYDHVVAIHDYGANAGAGYLGTTSGYDDPADSPTPGFDEPGYTQALDDYVDAGGNLVLTDSGVNLVTELDNTLVAGDAIAREDVTVSEFIVGRFEGDGEPKNLDHPLFGTEGDVRPIQNQLWKVQPLGYLPGSSDGAGQAPMYLPDETALAAAGESATTTVAGRSENPASAPSNNFGLTTGEPTEKGISAASLTPDDTTQAGVHLISSLLPTATQKNLHPFGLEDYTVTFLGYVMFTSALGFEQVRDTGEEVRRYGIGDGWNTEGVEHLDPPEQAPNFSADGSREDDARVFTGGQTNTVEITVDTIDGDVAADAEVTITDEVPDGWTVEEEFGDVESVEDGVVDLGTVTPADVDGDASVSRTYFVEAPEGTGNTGRYTFGPAEAEATIDGETVTDEVAGTDTNTVVGASTNF
jgi:hypothetical protein